jgi:FMN phosphatase YigB (HAD superfamily)
MRPSSPPPRDPRDPSAAHDPKDRADRGARPSSAGVAPTLLEGVDLVTFDCFGTLIDWSQALVSLGVGIDRMPQFLRESERRQRPDRRGAPFLSYRAILAEVGAALRPDLDPTELVRWARRFGELPFFADAPPAIALLGEVVDVGVISNCDAVHQIDVARRLGRAWDVCVVAEELESYKPLDKAWDRALAIVTDRGYPLDRWLHVSAWNDYDLQPAAARGIRTAYVPRPGAVAPPKGSYDLEQPDVLALARAIADAKGGPVAYEVEAEATDRTVLELYVEWIVDEHLGDVRACAGVRRAELVLVDGLRARSVYRFASRAAFARYLERDAPRLRARGRALFPEESVRLSRIEGMVRAVL